MIDIHSHIIPFVDDGSNTIESSIKMILDEQKMGVTDIICTPHFREPYLLDYKEINKRFNELKEEVKARNIPVNLYLGREVFYEPEIKDILEKDDLSINKSKYILIEFSTYDHLEFGDVVYELVLKGYKPIVAHVERYVNFSIEDAEDVKDAGGLIQINSDSVFKPKRKECLKLVRKMLKEKLVDFVASDIHDDRKNHLKKAHRYISRKCKKDYVEKIFDLNAKEILES